MLGATPQKYCSAPNRGYYRAALPRQYHLLQKKKYRNTEKLKEQKKRKLPKRQHPPVQYSAPRTMSLPTRHTTDHLIPYRCSKRSTSCSRRRLRISCISNHACDKTIPTISHTNVSVSHTILIMITTPTATTVAILINQLSVFRCLSGSGSIIGKSSIVLSTAHTIPTIYRTALHSFYRATLPRRYHLLQMNYRTKEKQY